MNIALVMSANHQYFCSENKNLYCFKKKYVWSQKIDKMLLNIIIKQLFIIKEKCLLWFQVPAQRNVKFYTCCDEPYLDITFNITMRRKTLFYTVNLIIPCMGISFLTILVFYLPSDSGEKVNISLKYILFTT